MDKWQQRFWEMAELVSTWSKDPRKQVGAVAVSPDKLQFTVGYNGYPRGIPDNRSHAGLNKNSLTVHAEVNAVLNSPTNVRGWSIYTTKAPCLNCAIVLIQAGIAHVYAPKLDLKSQWYPEQANATALMRKAGMSVVYFGEDND